MHERELAERLNGRQYTQEITTEEEADAKAAGLVVVFGGSDDLIEFRGAIHDERGAPRSIKIDASGLIPDRESIEDDEELRSYFEREPGARIIDAKWDQDGFSWIYETDIPHTTFEIMDDDDKYCRGIVFSLAILEQHIFVDDRPTHDDLLLWVLYHHQGGHSEIGQPIRSALGIGQFDHMSSEQILRGKWAAEYYGGSHG